MIDYIKYTVDGVTYSLIDNGDGTWSKSLTAPNVSGNYNLLLEISENGIISYLDSSDSRYEFYLDVIEETESVAHLQDYVPDFLSDVYELNLVYEIQNKEIDLLYADITKYKGDMWIRTASAEKVLELETFLRIKGQGTLSQRKDYLLSLFRKGKKLDESKIKSIANTITGSDCIVTFFAAADAANPVSGYGYLRVQILSPDNEKDYRYDDIARLLKPLVPSHIKLSVIKYFATWQDIADNYADWTAVAAATDWQEIRDYIPPSEV